MSQIKEAIILAGGLGTRLKSEVPDLPKCMAPVANRPFLSHVIDYFIGQGIERFIFSLGYMHEVVEQYIKKAYADISSEFVIENEPLGTGGAILLSCKYAREKNVLVLNGDTIYKIDVARLSSFHQDVHAECTLSLKPMEKFERYGVVEVDRNNRVESFKEKRYYEQGTINGGVYAINVSQFLERNLPIKFSFEKDYLEKEFQSGTIYGQVQDEYFIDIGIPEDFKRAQSELK